MPWALSVEPAGFCNLKCPECPLGAGVLLRRGGFMSMEAYRNILKESQPLLIWLNLYFQGEPFMNRHLSDMIGEAKRYSIFTSISTNGHFLDEKRCIDVINANLDEIIISLDGITDDSYSKYRKGGNLETVKNGVERLIKKRKELNSKTPFITVQFIVFKHNEHEIEELTKWCKKVKTDRLILKSAQINDFGNGSVAPAASSKYSRYTQNKDGVLVMKGAPRNYCLRQWSSAVISWDGQMAPCCYDKDLKFSPGNINTFSLKQLWTDESMQKFRQQILIRRKDIDICQNCPEGR
ncbi:MAG: SPASM domain-containing protein [Cytophagaceae bacterium]|jgi:radical SAM protein with 4Fe4S-binding SPASM domain|nr:SPASM domain-containing protein [Cytophagaceae bacterium]